MKRIAVFCASSVGVTSIYTESAYNLGKVLAEKGIQIIYGGAGVGSMGALARGAIDTGGEIIGVLPKFLIQKENAQLELSELILVDSMHERKLKMNELSDAVITLPGGFGTMEEFFEIITWGQLGLHQKPIGILNTNNYYDLLIKFIKHMNREKLLRDEFMKMLLVSNKIPELLEKMQNYVPMDFKKYLQNHKT